MTIRVAFVGAGQMARNHLRTLRRATVPAMVVGVHDPAPAQADEFAALAGAPAFASLQNLLDQARPDVVHVCTPPAAHVDAARAALDAGAHVYVEKPFAPTMDDARRLVELGRARGRLVCAGHQMLRDPAFRTLLARGAELGELVQVDSHFAFRPPAAWMARAGARMHAQQLVDILPHPLYQLIATLEQFGTPGAAIELEWMRCEPADVQAIVRAGDLVGRLSVTLRGRPVASTVTLVGTRGSLSCDLVRTIVVGSANPGTEALEKVLNPVLEGVQLITRTTRSVARRLSGGVAYPGLAELIGAFYTAIIEGTPSPVSDGHLLRVTAIFEAIAARIEAAVPGRATLPLRGSIAVPASVAARAVASATPHMTSPSAPLVALTGARGFLGAEIARALDRVRGVGRGANPDDPHVTEWVIADLSRGISADAFAGADLVVHAAAETAGDFAAHQRNTIDATRHLLGAMQQAGAKRLILVGSLSVIRPPRTPWERQDERTPRAGDPDRLGPYTWGKTLQEELVEREAPSCGIAVRIIRPGALFDRNDPTLPGLMGRHLFGRWHLGLGRPQLPIAVCDVARCADAIAWCATHFDEAPPLVNLFDPEVTTRGAFLRLLRAGGWRGRVVWAPISAISIAIVAARTAQSLLSRRWPSRVPAWSTLKPRRYDGRLAAEVLASCR